MRIWILLAACLMAGCSSLSSKPHPLKDGYDLGDGVLSIYYRVDQVKALEARYCAESDPLARRILLTAIQRIAPKYPDEGICGIPERVDGHSTPERRIYLTRLLTSLAAVLIYVWR